MNNTVAHIVIVAMMCVQMLCAQTLTVRQGDAAHSYPANSRVASVIDHGMLVSASAAGDDETMRYIIEVFPASSGGGALLQKTMSADAALARTAVRLQLDALSLPVQTLYEYRDVINGFCVVTQRGNYTALKNIHGVARVSEDVQLSFIPVTASSTVTSPASPVHDIATGKGIRVGIIDTGIDYRHEAFGGGSGGNNTVCGGYDFVNNDADPMDDNGHGTHVAGIIAGNSHTITGMAIGASLYSYKALDASGGGYMSTVIAAIERAIQDSVKVINLSLGTSAGDPDDLLSRAVDRAAEKGIVVVAAAGNAGEFGTIGSPGAARSALTVGAVDAHNIIASFSSKGPTQKNFGMKPDVVAPGVSILSAKMGGGYVSMSGTSMSAPYVAGVAASLAEVHPEWSAAQIRDAIIESAQHLNYDWFTAGSGRVDPLRAARMQTVATPGSISLGFIAQTTAPWTKRETVYVANANAASQTYTLSTATSSPCVTIALQSSSLAVAPYQRAAVIADIHADNSLLAENLSLHEGYTGTITAVSALDTIRIPFAFFKGTVLHMQFDETPAQLILHNQKDKQYSFQPKTNTLAVVLPSGTYDVLAAYFPSHYVVRESVQLAGLVSMQMNKTEAKNPIRILPIDESGTPVAAGLPHEVFSSIDGIVHRESGISMISTCGGPYTAAQSMSVKYISNVSSRYVFGTTVNIQKGNSTTYTYEVALETGIADSVTVQFSSRAAAALDVRYDVDTVTTKSIFPIVWSCAYLQGVMVSVNYYDGTAEPLRAPFTQKSVYFKQSSPSFPIFNYREGYKY
jgi:subtilisin family serine protease